MVFEEQIAGLNRARKFLKMPTPQIDERAVIVVEGQKYSFWTAVAVERTVEDNVSTITLQTYESSPGGLPIVEESAKRANHSAKRADNGDASFAIPASSRTFCFGGLSPEAY